MAADRDDEDKMSARLKALKGELAQRAERRAPAAPTDRQAPDGGGFGPGATQAMQAGTEFVVSILLGSAIGYGLDRWLGSKPWLLIAFFLLGTAAGVRSVIRLASPKGRGEVRNSPLSAGQAPDKDVPRSASEAARRPPDGGDEDED